MHRRDRPRAKEAAQPAPAAFSKDYPDERERERAEAHLRLLTSACHARQAHVRVARLPRHLGGDGRHLLLEHATGRHPAPADLPVVGTALGELHAAVHRVLPEHVSLSETAVADSLAIPSFPQGRQTVLTAFPLPFEDLPAAVYKDCNIRNVLVEESRHGPAARSVARVVFVDFDDLTLAPFGYDLGKLLVSAAMTWGHLPDGTAEATLHAYNEAAAPAAPSWPGGAPCTQASLALYCAIHDMLTSRYLGRNGYEHPWQNTCPPFLSLPTAGRTP